MEVQHWEEGDCILLPFHPDGIEHRHFNRGTEPAKWLAFIHLPTWNHVASEMSQMKLFVQEIPPGSRSGCLT